MLGVLIFGAVISMALYSTSQAVVSKCGTKSRKKNKHKSDLFNKSKSNHTSTASKKINSSSSEIANSKKPNSDIDWEEEDELNAFSDANELNEKAGEEMFNGLMKNAFTKVLDNETKESKRERILQENIENMIRSGMVELKMGMIDGKCKMKISPKGKLKIQMLAKMCEETPPMIKRRIFEEMAYRGVRPNGRFDSLARGATKAVNKFSEVKEKFQSNAEDFEELELEDNIENEGNQEQVKSNFDPRFHHPSSREYGHKDIEQDEVEFDFNDSNWEKDLNDIRYDKSKPNMSYVDDVIKEPSNDPKLVGDYNFLLGRFSLFEDKVHGTDSSFKAYCKTTLKSIDEFYDKWGQDALSDDMIENLNNIELKLSNCLKDIDNTNTDTNETKVDTEESEVKTKESSMHNEESQVETKESIVETKEDKVEVVPFGRHAEHPQSSKETQAREEITGHTAQSLAGDSEETLTEQELEDIGNLVKDTPKSDKTNTEMNLFS